MPEKSTTPRANIPEKTTPMATSSRSPERRAMSPTVSALATAAIEPPIARFTFSKNAMTTPGNAACEIASPRNARPRRTTNTPTEAHTIPTRTLPTSARCTNVNASGAKRSGMVLVAVQLRPAGAVAAVRLAEDPVVAEHGRRTVGDDPAVERDDAREVRHHAREVVGRDDDGLPFRGELLEHAHELLLGRRIDARRGLVEQENVRPRYERPREQHALPLASGERGDRALREVARVDPCERGARILAIGGGRAPADPELCDPAHEDDVLDEERVVPAQRFRLREIRDAAGLPSARAQDPDAAAHRRQQPGDDLQQGRLPGAVRPDECEQLAGAHGEVHVAQDGDAVVPGADVLELDRPGGLDHGERGYRDREGHFSASTIFFTSVRMRPR